MTKTRATLLLALLAAASTPVGARQEEKPSGPVDLTSLSPFGIGSCHSNNWGADPNTRWVPKMTAIGVTNTRTCNSGWSEVEPEEGKWRFGLLDKQMAYYESQGIAFGGILIG